MVGEKERDLWFNFIQFYAVNKVCLEKVQPLLI